MARTALLRLAAWMLPLIASAQSGTTAAPPMADIVNLSGEKLAIYAIGTLVDGGKNEVPDFEVMTDLLGAGQSAVHGLKYDTALIVRSANLVWRAKISLYQGGDAARPYVLAFKNLMFDHIHGSAPPEARGIEIKLGEGGGFVWVRPFEEELQTTDVGHSVRAPRPVPHADDLHTLARRAGSGGALRARAAGASPGKRRPDAEDSELLIFYSYE